MRHKRDRSRSFLGGDFAGHLPANGFSGYDQIYAGAQVVEGGWDVRARREFGEAQKSDGARADTALAHDLGPCLIS
jgi:hypothetical protein